jgi:cob(I)alamin adenosyltransferase
VESVRIYTKTGDKGETGLPGGQRVAKDDARVTALGEIDELNAVLGKARSEVEDWERVRSILASLQRDLLALGALVAGARAAGLSAGARKSDWDGERVTRIEALIDESEAALPDLRTFILPGGSPLGATLQAARAVCRRAERAVVTLTRGVLVEPTALAYLNRLSDLLFVLAREANGRAGVPDEPW